MKRICAVGTCLLGLMLFHGETRAAPGGVLPVAVIPNQPAFVSITIDGETATFDLTLGTNGLYTGRGAFQTANGSAEFDVMADPDPSIAYGLAAVDAGAPSSFVFGFFLPFAPLVGPNVVTASIVGGLTDATGDGVSITPFGQPLVQKSEVTAPLTSMGVDVGAAVAFGPGSPGSFYGYGPYAAGPIPGPVGAWTGLMITTSFTLSGGGDVAALTGFASIDPIPEPSTVALAGLGCAALLIHGARRQWSRRPRHHP